MKSHLHPVVPSHVPHIPALSRSGLRHLGTAGTKLTCLISSSLLLIFTSSIYQHISTYINTIMAAAETAAYSGMNIESIHMLISE